MPGLEIVLDPIDFITIGTLGPKGRRVFYLQAGKGAEIVSLIIEKQQAQALAEAIGEILDDLAQRDPHLAADEETASRFDMTLRGRPEDALFRVAQMGLGYDEDRDLMVLVAQEMVTGEEDYDPQPRSVRMWATREQLWALGQHARSVVKKGRADPKTNGFMIYYWT